MPRDDETDLAVTSANAIMLVKGSVRSRVASEINPPPEAVSVS
jgi:hypothetical protein